MSSSQTAVTLLMVEDDPDYAQAVEDILQRVTKAKFNVVHAYSMDSAIRRLDDTKIDVITLDLNLPDSAGIETYLRMHEKASHLPIIIMSGSNDDELALQAAKKGAQYYLVKGQFNTQLLERAILYAIEHNRLAKSMDSPVDKFAGIFLQSPDAMALIEASDGKFKEVNQTFCRLCGFERDVLLNQHFTTLFPDNPQSSKKELLVNTHVWDAVFGSQLLLCEGGVTKNVDLTASLVPWDNADVILVNIRESTEPELEHIPVTDLVRLLTDIYSTKSSAVIVCNLDRTCVYHNRDFAELFQYSVETGVEVKWEDTLGEKYKASINKVLKNLPDTESASIEFWWERTKGDLRFLRTIARKLTGSIFKQTLILIEFEDETEKRRSEALNRVYEQRLNFVTEKSAEWIWEIERTGKIVYSNEALVKWGAIKEGTIGGKPLTDIFTEHDHPLLSKLFLDSGNKSKAIHDVSAQIRLLDGSVKDVVLDADPIYSAAKEIVGFRGICKPILKPVIVEPVVEKMLDPEPEIDLKDVLKTTANRLLQESIDYSHVVCDSEGTIVSVNSQFSALSKYAETELSGNKIFDYLTAKDAQLLQALINSDDSEHAIPVKLTVVNKDNDRIKVEATWERISFQENRIGCAFYLKQPAAIVEKAAVTKAETKDDSFIDLPDVVIYKSGAENYLSANINKVLGFEIDSATHNLDFLGGLIHPDDFEVTQKSLEAWHKTEEHGIHEQEIRIKRHDGSYAWMLDKMKVAKTDISGAQTYIGVLIDVTERKLNELKTADSQTERINSIMRDLHETRSQLERASHYRDEFLSFMGQVLRPPLINILGLTEVLKVELKESLDLMQADVLSTVEHNAQNLLELLNDLIDMSMIEAGVFSLNPESVPIEQSCRQALDHVHDLATAGKISIKSTVDITTEFIQIDERRLKQILINLLKRAIRTSEPLTSIGLDVSMEPTGTGIQFTIWDGNKSFTPEEQHLLFSPFTHLSTTFTPLKEDDGLGLALSYLLADLMGGSMMTMSGVDGNRFTVTLPQSGNKMDTARKSDKIKFADGEKKTILIADDNEVELLRISNYLKNVGFIISTAGNGEELLEKLYADKPNVVIMDIRMTRIDGIETMNIIRNDSKYKQIPIIATTSLCLSDTRSKVMKAGANSFIVKPINLKSLVGKVESLLL